MKSFFWPPALMASLPAAYSASQSFTVLAEAGIASALKAAASVNPITILRMVPSRMETR